MHFWTTILRSLRLRCPQCGRGRFAKSWIATHDECHQCGLDFRVDWGFYLGSIYVSYGVTGVILVVTCVPLVVGQYVAWNVLTPITVVFCIVFPFWFWRYARSIWFGINFYLDHGQRMRRSPAKQDQPVPAGAAVIRSGAAHDAPSSAVAEFVFICPHCHTAAGYPEYKRRKWSECSHCGEAVLLIPIPPNETPSRQQGGKSDEKTADDPR